MNEQEVERQIDQMVRFIKQEAEEKANEIKVSSEEEFNIEKLQLLDTEKAKIKKEYERRESQIDVKKKIEYSKQLNDSRIAILSSRDEAIRSILTEAKGQLVTLSKNKGKYKSLLTDLIAQAMGKLMEPEVVVRVRECDKELVKEAAEGAKTKFKEAFKGATCNITVDSSNYLPPPPSGKDHDEAADSCTGGVVLTNKAGSIVCSNTLDDRLKIAYAQNLPDIRAALFGIEAPARA
ncbi:hypothetical protein WJX73_001527 [Symbiochloris irregularis]|uniref:Vacuolar ATP synthase subunit E n=1 Tax=Symbiochloris irregularis TaxID=706552 RepID=A0AAW1NNM7_9CHLO